MTKCYLCGGSDGPLETGERGWADVSGWGIDTLSFHPACEEQAKREAAVITRINACVLLVFVAILIVGVVIA